MVTKKTKIQTQTTLSLGLDKKKTRVTWGQSEFSLMGLTATKKTMKGPAEYIQWSIIDLDPVC